ncbi:MAG: hypothetical protein A3H45_07855 [Ignavibacteria bacterium RIFCSPLOWO2_02_FULL_55_14]|nr:MAG: hypothetical protein A3H45_07855 [Ignavibacteria bacterium RIFCSPLOWO2_02_FULL_55_14]OGU71788.1 MAG: hypothetical protein A3G43_07385 [Ignavibacteria bacterium RIFCSPLOWO2_12_FULL_56_21]
MKSPDKTVLRELQTIPGIGPSIARDLVELGIRRVQDLRGKDPERLYRLLCRRQGLLMDRCLLYVFRCAVYYAETKKAEARLLLWWNWKDTPSVARKAKLALISELGARTTGAASRSSRVRLSRA